MILFSGARNSFQCNSGEERGWTRCSLTKDITVYAGTQSSRKVKNQTQPSSQWIHANGSFGYNPITWNETSRNLLKWWVRYFDGVVVRLEILECTSAHAKELQILAISPSSPADSHMSFLSAPEGLTTTPRNRFSVAVGGVERQPLDQREREESFVVWTKHRIQPHESITRGISRSFAADFL